ncbi:MAG: CvpA family protein [Gammaproteobacteria bacterium]|nr:CvpA family protein [Gammaproteobacteria bacterium]
MSDLNWVDYIILIIFFFSILTGLARGFVREIISLITLIAAFIVAIVFSNPLAQAFTSSPTVQNVVTQASTSIGMNTTQPVSYLALGLSFGLLFAGTVLVGSIIGYFANAAFQAGVLGIGNRLFGGVFGLIRGYIINLVLIFLVQMTPLSAEAWWQQSKLVAAYQPSVVWLGGVVSPSLANLKAKFGETFQGATSTLKDLTDTYGGYLKQ